MWLDYLPTFGLNSHGIWESKGPTLPVITPNLEYEPELAGSNGLPFLRWLGEKWVYLHKVGPGCKWAQKEVF